MSTLSPAGESVRTRMSRAGRDRAPAVLVDAVLAYVVPEEDLLDPATVEIVAIP